MRRIVRGPAVKLALAVLCVGLAAVLFLNSGSFLVVDTRRKSEALVITQGDSLDAQYWMALRLLGEGYGRELLLDARANLILFGRSQADLAAEFIHRTAAGMEDRVRVCAIQGDTTAQETYEVDQCLKNRDVHDVLLVVDDFHSRRSLAMFSRLLPHYRWSIAAVPDATKFGPQWWRKREWIRTTIVEWQHLLWWELVDRWRFPPVTEYGTPVSATGQSPAAPGGSRPTTQMPIARMWASG
ncbi:MAG TPA: ElyC/SanA/YdcF family protein [Bryobacteraceae bacterium]|nr:ElyC/SanA/YdcF family protein [Bryobacteraceae bacterium]